MSDAIIPVKMPKWGLSMSEGTLTSWFISAGDQVNEGDDLADIETSKITNVYESPFAGTVRRLCTDEGNTLPVGALLAVIAPSEVDDAAIDAFIEDYNANFVPEEDGDGEDGPAGFEFNAGPFNIRMIKAGNEDANETPFLLIHGFGGDTNNWLFVLDELGENRPVFAMDLPGHGLSSKQVGDGSLETLAETVKLVIEGLETDKVHLIGHSMGGAVALRVALEHPDSVASLGLICAAGLPGTSLNGEYITGFIDARRRKDLKPFASQLFRDEALVSRDMLEGLIRYKRLDGVTEALTKLRDNALSATSLDALGARLDALEVPLTVLASHHDQIVGAPDEAQLPQNTTTIWVDEAGHMPQIESAKATAEALLQKIS